MSSCCPIGALDKNDTLLRIYYLKGQPAEPCSTQPMWLLAGGYRSSLDLFDNGQIVYATWQSLSPDRELTLYSLGKGKPRKKRKQPFKSVGTQTAEQGSWDFGQAAGPQQSSTGKHLTVQGTPNQQQKQKRKNQKASKCKSVCRIFVFEKNHLLQLHLQE